MSKTRAVDWSSLDSGPLGEISGHLIFHQEYATFRSVCKSWWKASPSRRVVPCLVSHHKDSNGERTLLTFHRLVSSSSSSSDGAGLNLSQFRELPFGSRTTCHGLSFGWVALLYIYGPRSVVLRNQFTMSEIRLLSLPLGNTQVFRTVIRGQSHYVPSWELFVLSADPTTSPSDYECLVSSSCDKGIALWSERERAWTKFRGVGGFTGAVFYNGHFYVSRFNGHVYVCSGSNLKKIASVPCELDVVPVINGSCHRPINAINRSLLVKSGGDLLLVMVYWTGTTYHFLVFKVLFAAEGAKLVALEDLGDRALFLGKNNSFSVEASRTPGCQKNKIYCIEVGSNHLPKATMNVRAYDMNTIFVASDAIGPRPDWTPCDWFVPNILPSNLEAAD